MKIFGTIYPFVESNDASLKLGRYVANYDFFRALLKYSNFDEYHIFCMNAVHFKNTSNRLLSEDISDSQKRKVKLYLFDHLINMISSTDYHVFHLGGWGYFFSGLAYLRNNYAKNIFPITGLIHSLNGKETNFHAFKMLNAPLMPYDTIICSSNAGKKVIEKSFSRIESQTDLTYKGDFSIIPLGVEEKSVISRKMARTEENLSNGTIRILTIGRLSPATKFDPYPLIISVADVINTFPDKNIELIIAGGANASEIALVNDIIHEEKVEIKIKVISNFDDRKKEILYNSSDIYVSLIDNLQETFGISVIEAMQAGLPVVISDINGYKELVEDNISGFKIPSLWCNNSKANELSSIMDFSTLQMMLAQNMSVDLDIFKKRLIRLIKDTELRKSIGEAAIKRVKNNYLWKNIIHQYEELWKNLHSKSTNISTNMKTKTDIFGNDYIDAFSHYPSSILSNKMIINITVRGKNCLVSQQVPVAYNNIQPLLDSSQILHLLNELNDKTMTIEKAIRIVDNFTILWMSKYGLISISNGVN